MVLLSSAEFCSKLTFSKKYFRNTIRLPNGLNPDKGGVQIVWKGYQKITKKTPLARKEWSKLQKGDKILSLYYSLNNFFATMLINSIIQEHTKKKWFVLSYDTIIPWNPTFGVKLKRFCHIYDRRYITVIYMRPTLKKNVGLPCSYQPDQNKHLPKQLLPFWEFFSVNLLTNPSLNHSKLYFN